MELVQFYKSLYYEKRKFIILSYHDKKPFSSYSLGMKQRLGIANALMNEPEFLILDEPTNGLEPIGIAELREFIRNLSVKEGKTILISSHQLSEIEQLIFTGVELFALILPVKFASMIPWSAAMLFGYGMTGEYTI